MTAKTAYHHGNLRQALLDEALALVAEKGVDGLSLREVAARVGVSHAAPYHHFADKTDLVRALAREGMRLMGARMQQARDAAGSSPRERLLAIGVAYVAFAEEQPAYYAIFNALEANSETTEAPSEDDGQTWELLLSAVLDCQRSGDLPPGDPVVVAVYLWSLVHGLAELWRSGPLGRMPQASAGVEPFARHVLATAFWVGGKGATGDSAPDVRGPEGSE